MARERKGFAPLVAVATLGMVLGLWRALSPGIREPMMASLTVLATPGRGNEPTVAEVFEGKEAADAVAGDNGATRGVEANPTLPEPATTAMAERQAHPPPRVVPRRAVPAARPKAPGSASSTASEPDVGF
jgi:hypothetical protein